MRAKWIFTVIVILILGITITIIASPKLVSGATDSDLRLYAGICGCVFLLLLRLIYINLLRPIKTISDGMELVRTQDFSSRLVKVGQKDADQLVGMFNKMIDYLKQERIKNMEQNHFLQLLIKSSPSGITILDFDGAITLINPAMLSLMNIDEENALGKKPEEIGGEMSRAISEIPFGESATVRLSDNMIVRISRLSFMETGFARPFIMAEIMTDEVRNAEKEAYGKVIRLISHEVNNTMTGVKSMLDTISTVMDNEPDIAEAIESCSDRCDSLKDFITSYADVVRIPTARLTRIDLCERIRSMIPFLEGLAGKYANIKLNLPEREVYTEADPVLLEQVMVNIVKNSTESIMSSGREGKIEISLNANPPRIEITDNGAGISVEASKKLFSPFFSTKRGGQGLGLMMVGDILSQHGCKFSLRTDEPTGESTPLTRFKIEFKR